MESEQVLRDLYNQKRSGQLEGHSGRLDTIRRRLLMVEKGAVGDALRKQIVPEDLAQPYLKKLDEQLLALENE